MCLDIKRNLSILIENWKIVDWLFLLLHLFLVLRWMEKKSLPLSANNGTNNLHRINADPVKWLKIVFGGTDLELTMENGALFFSLFFCKSKHYRYSIQK